MLFFADCAVHKDMFGVSLDLVGLVLSGIQERECLLSALNYLLTVLNAGIPLPAFSAAAASSKAHVKSIAPAPIDSAGTAVLQAQLGRTAPAIIGRVLYGICGALPDLIVPKLIRVLHAYFARYCPSPLHPLGLFMFRCHLITCP